MTEPSIPFKTAAKKPRLRRRTLALAVIAGALLVAGAAAVYSFRSGHPPAGAGGGEGQGARYGGQDRAQPVSVAAVGRRDVPLWLTAIGSAVPRNLVTVRTRVDGELFKVHFTEGQTVKQGQLLAEIDPRPFQAQLTQANGQLARDSALLQNARIDLERYRDLWSKDSIPRQQLDTQEALVRQYQGTVENDRGLVENAKVQLAYTRISAPVSGRVGLRLVDPGNQVHAADANGLVSIAQLQPMTVVFAVPETDLPGINRRLGGGDPLPVEAWDRDQKNRLAAGRLLTTDNQIDLATGTIKLKAEFANADNALFPNQFVNVRLLLGTQKDATVVPGAAVMRGAHGAFVYTVDGANGVKSVPVAPGAADGELVAVEGAVKPGDRVVTDGADKLRDGAKVEVISPERRTAAAGGPQRRSGNRAQRPGGAP